MKVSIISARSIRRKVGRIAITAAIVGGVYAGVGAYDMLRESKQFRKDIQQYEVTMRTNIGLNVAQSYKTYQHDLTNLFTSKQKSALKKLYTSELEKYVDNYILACESRYGYEEAKRFLNDIDTLRVLNDMDSKRTSIEKFNPRKALKDAASASLNEKIKIYESLIGSPELSGMRDSLIKKRNDSRFEVAITALKDYFSISKRDAESLPNAIDHMMSYKSDYIDNIKILSNMDYLTDGKKKAIYSIFESQMNTCDRIEGVSEIIAATGPILDVKPVAKTYIDSHLRSLLKQDVISQGDLNNYDALKIMNDYAQAGLDSRLKSAYIEMIPKVDASEREKMLNTVLEDYLGYTLNENREALVRAIKSIQTDNKADQAKYKVMILGLGGR